MRFPHLSGRNWRLSSESTFKDSNRETWKHATIQRPERSEGWRALGAGPRETWKHVPTQRPERSEGWRALGVGPQRKLKMSIIVTGSIAFDYLMSFPGKF